MRVVFTVIVRNEMTKQSHEIAAPAARDDNLKTAAPATRSVQKGQEGY